MKFGLHIGAEPCCWVDAHLHASHPCKKLVAVQALHLFAAYSSGSAACCSPTNSAGSTLCDCNQFLARVICIQVCIHLAARHCTSVQHIFLALLFGAVLQTVPAVPYVTATSFLQGSSAYRCDPLSSKVLHLCAAYFSGCAAWCSSTSCASTPYMTAFSSLQGWLHAGVHPPSSKALHLCAAYLSGLAVWRSSTDCASSTLSDCIQLLAGVNCIQM